MSTKGVPNGAVVIKSYQAMARIVEDFLKGKLPFLMITGPAGKGKSEMIKRMIKRRSHKGAICIIKPHATPLALYQQAYKFRNLPLVLDNLDGMYARNAYVVLLKCLCRSTTIREMKWFTTHPAIGDEPGKTPALYETSSPVCLIANRRRTANVTAVESRATLIVYFDLPTVLGARPLPPSPRQ